MHLYVQCIYAHICPRKIGKEVGQIREKSGVIPISGQLDLHARDCGVCGAGGSFSYA
jgi:hypothetical protein